MIRSAYRSSTGKMTYDIPLEDLSSAIQDSGGVLWVDFLNEPAETCSLILRETFGFHPLAIDDALVESHIPKVDDWETYLYLVLHEVEYSQSEDDPLVSRELDIFFGPNFLVTYQTQPIKAIDVLWSVIQRDERHLQRGTGRLLYKLVDELANDFMPVVDAIDEAIDHLEDQIFSDPEPAILEHIFRLKRALPQLRRSLNSQREVLNKLARGDFPALAFEDRIYFRDVYDHFVRLHDITEGLRDLVSGALETYLSVVSNRMNEIMKTLTVITTMFMPISFLAGFFGMNFFQPVMRTDTWTGQFAFYVTLSAIVLLPLAMLLWMRRRAWM